MMWCKESIDLMNVDYDDVLHLYRGWRKSESALKDKDKELSALKDRIKLLQDSHGKFRNQIQALESVKELTITLQNQLSTLQQDNRILVSENRELANLNIQAEALLKEKEEEEIEQSKIFKEVQLEFATLKGRYEETLKAQKELEKLAGEEQTRRMAAESRLAKTDQIMEGLREENRSLRSQVEAASHKLEQCDQELLHASEQLSSISREVVNISTTKEALNSAESETGVLKGDISRLLRLLEQSPATKEFINHWKDSNGMHFVGVDRDPSIVTRGSNSSYGPDMLLNALSKSNIGGFDGEWSGQDMNEAKEAALSKYDLSPADFNHLKSIYGGDPFPMSSNMTDETEYWVPEDAAKLGMQFMAQRFPHASPKIIMDFLRGMNRIWLRRERRKVKRVKEVLGTQISDLKRQLSHTKPYHGIIAERQIRRLKSQVLADQAKLLKGRPKGKLEQSAAELYTFEEADFDVPELPHERRLCKLTQRAKHQVEADVTRVSTEKLLEASLNSLESMSHRMARTSTDHTYNDDVEGYEGEYTTDRVNSTVVSKTYPSASYLRGALWLGRNMTLVSEEVADNMDKFRTKFLAEVSDISNDPDPKRGCHRLTLLASSGMNHACSITSKAKTTMRSILQTASSLEPGNAAQLERFLATLPIESALAGGSTQGIQHHRRSTSASRAVRRSEDSAVQSSPRRSPSNRSIRFSSILDSPLHTDDLNRSYNQSRHSHTSR